MADVLKPFRYRNPHKNQRINMSSSHPDLTSTKTGWEPRFFSLFAALPPKLLIIIGIISGALGVTSFSPFHFWPGYFFSLVVFSLLDILIQRVHVDIKSNVAETLAYSPDFFLHNVGALANDHIKRLLLTVIIADKLILKRDITLKCPHISLAPCSSDN